jgi:hypothetical protein
MVGVVIGVVVLWILVKVVKEIRVVRDQYIRFVDYLLEKGVGKVEVIPPIWNEYGRVRLYDREGRFVEELVVMKKEWWFCVLMCGRLKRDGFEVEVKRI